MEFNQDRENEEIENIIHYDVVFEEGPIGKKEEEKKIS